MSTQYRIEWPMKPGVLTPAYMEKLSKRIARIEFKSIFAHGYVVKPPWYPTDPPVFLIEINSFDDEEEQVNTLIHELIHIAFSLCGYKDSVLPHGGRYYGKAKKIEDFVVEATRKFCTEYPDFARSLFERLAKGIATENHQHSRQLELPLRYQSD